MEMTQDLAAEPRAVVVEKDRFTREAPKPIGGFRLIYPRTMLVAWLMYRRKKQITWRAFRTYLALHEICEKRDASNRTLKAAGKKPQQYSFQPNAILNEVHALVGGVGGQYVREDIGSLKRAGLVDAGCKPVAFPEISDELAEVIEGKLAMVGRKRSVPFPRRMLRFIAGGASRNRGGTLLGHMMRCMYWWPKLGERGLVKACGSCSAELVAQVFEIHSRNVRKERGELRRIRWLFPVDAHWRSVNRNGSKWVVNLEWNADDALETVVNSSKSSEFQTAKSPGGAGISTGESPGLICNSKSSTNIKRQVLNPGKTQAPRTVFSENDSDESPPQLGDITGRDFKDTQRMLALFDQAVERGLIPEHETVLFVALMVHAAKYGKDPVRLFSYMLRRKETWGWVNWEEEKQARKKVDEYYDPGLAQENRERERERRMSRSEEWMYE